MARFFCIDPLSTVSIHPQLKCQLEHGEVQAFCNLYAGVPRHGHIERKELDTA